MTKINKIMSSYILFCLFFSISSLNVFAAPSKKHKTSTVLKIGIKKDVKKQKPEIPSKKEFQIPLIEDELAKDINIENVKKINYQQNLVEDDTASELPAETSKKRFKYKKEILKDEPVIISEENKKLKRSDYKKQVKTERGVAVVLKPIQKISTKNKKLKVHKDGKVDKYKLPYPFIGHKVAFKVVKDVVKDEKILIEKDTIVYAKIGEVSPRAMGGAPAEMTLENFEMYNKDGKLVPLDGEIASSGYSLSVWIGLAELATTPFLFGLAVPLLRVLPGGQAVITPRKNYVVYY